MRARHRDVITIRDVDIWSIFSRLVGVFTLKFMGITHVFGHLAMSYTITLSI